MKIMKVIYIIDIQNGKHALLCSRFVYLRLSRIGLSLFRFLLLNNEYLLLKATDIELIPLAQNARV